MQIGFPSVKFARMVCDTLNVDRELKPNQVQRVCTTDGSVLSVRFVSREPRMLRTSVTGFIDAVSLATNTLVEFG